MSTVSSTRAPVVPQSNTSRAAWREEMLGQFLEHMREHSLPEEVVNPMKTEGLVPFKGQYIDVYV
jgi:hypothetical protein